MAVEPTVFVVDDDTVFLEYLGALLKSVGLSAEVFTTAEEFLAQYTPTRPGCLLLDVRMPGMSGLNLQEELAARRISLPVIIITGYPEWSTAVRALKTGAVDFIQKPIFSDQLLLDRIRQAIETDRQTRDLEAQRAEVAARVAQLTTRERQVMELVVAGKPNKLIAADLGLSPKTVEVHRANVMKKMAADSLAELVRLQLLAPSSKPSTQA
jgi:FixJ family two-component response regulator